MKWKKLSARLFGQWGEGLACMVLRLKGYRIIARNFRHPLGEIDIIATSKRSICFVEVKSRPTLTLAKEALGYTQQNRIRRAASAFLCVHPRYSDRDIRFDLMCVTPFCWPRHFKNAWIEKQ